MKRIFGIMSLMAIIMVSFTTQASTSVEVFGIENTVYADCVSFEIDVLTMEVEITNEVPIVDVGNEISIINSEGVEVVTTTGDIDNIVEAVLKPDLICSDVGYNIDTLGFDFKQVQIDIVNNSNSDEASLDNTEDGMFGTHVGKLIGGSVDSNNVVDTDTKRHSDEATEGTFGTHVGKSTINI